MFIHIYFRFTGPYPKWMNFHNYHQSFDIWYQVRNSHPKFLIKCCAFNVKTWRKLILIANFLERHIFHYVHIFEVIHICICSETVCSFFTLWFTLDTHKNISFNLDVCHIDTNQAQKLNFIRYPVVILNIR